MTIINMKNIDRSEIDLKETSQILEHSVSKPQLENDEEDSLIDIEGTFSYQLPFWILHLYKIYENNFVCRVSRELQKAWWKL